MMRIDVITGFPKLLQSPLEESILKRAQAAGLAEIVVHDLRDYAHSKHRNIDDTPYGGGAGMILKPEPIFECVDALKAERSYGEVILTTPQGERYTQQTAVRLSLADNLMIICGHYKGVDDRVRQALVTMELSIGDYVLTGGELAALIVIDSTVRLLPGVVGDAESVLNDSFQEGLLDCPYYTKPAEYRGLVVPDVLLQGDHEAVRKWRENAAQELTAERRPDLIADAM